MNLGEGKSWTRCGQHSDYSTIQWPPLKTCLKGNEMRSQSVKDEPLCVGPKGADTASPCVKHAKMQSLF